MKDQLQQLRKSKKLTQEDISRIIDVKLSTYQKYERDVISPPYDTLIRIADFYGVTTDYLLGRNTDEPNAIDKLANEFHISVLERKIINKYLSLPKDLRSNLMELLFEAAKEVQIENSNKDSE